MYKSISKVASRVVWIIVMGAVLMSGAVGVKADELEMPREGRGDGLPPECVGMEHHAASKWALNGLRSGAAQVWRSGPTLVAVITVAECGGMIMFAKWRYGQLITNFFPATDAKTVSAQRKLAQAYAIKNVISGSVKIGGATALKFISMPFLMVLSPDELCRRDRSLCGLPQRQ